MITYCDGWNHTGRFPSVTTFSPCYSAPMRINFVTTNTLKFEIAQTFFEKLEGDYVLAQRAIDTPEIQDSSVEKIALQSAIWAAKETGEPCIKLDVGFFIASLNGFPGPFVKYINEWLSQEDVLNLVKSKDNRSAYFEDALAIAYPDGEAKVFSQKINGTLAESADLNNTKWPMNSLFIPQGQTRTLGSMSNDEQNKFWGDGNWPRLIEFLER